MIDPDNKYVFIITYFNQMLVMLQNILIENDPQDR